MNEIANGSRLEITVPFDRKHGCLMSMLAVSSLLMMATNTAFPTGHTTTGHDFQRCGKETDEVAIRSI